MMTCPVADTAPRAMTIADPIPLLSPACAPPVVIGAAALVTAAMHGATVAALAAMVDGHDGDPVARLYDLSIVTQLAFRREEALRLQAMAVAASPLLRIRREDGSPPAIRLLALVMVGDLMANTPLDFITNHLDVRLDLLFLTPGQPLPAVIPEHDAMFFAAGEPDPATLARLCGLFAAWPRPVLNDPGFLPDLSRDRLAALLAGIPEICSPPAVEIGRSALEDHLRHGDGIATLLPGCAYPVLVRPVGSHAGLGLARLDGPDDLAGYLSSSPAVSYYLTAFVDYRASDGLYRKYRVAFIDRAPHLCHMAVSREWMVHYLNASMTQSAAKRAEEAQAMAHFTAAFGALHRDAFAALHARLGFDCYSIDCAELPDGRLLVFEADTAAIIHMMDPVDMFAYKHTQMRGVFDAFGDMLRRRVAAISR
jgi:hypothetical protein